MKYEVKANQTNHTCDWCNSVIIADYKIRENSLDLTYHACEKHLNQNFMPEERMI